ncbi:hypothetical protein EPO33_05080 [Patescibacteria group bacterium]|nr:MAG: hypothetical protein EPO33_05080 [Patescibacteria group bacterium]
MDPVARAVLATVAYFDLFQVPLTALEVWRNLFWSAGAPPGLGDVEAAIARLVAEGKLTSQEGYVSLPGGAPASLRLMREADALRKWRRLRFGARLLSAVPFLQGIAAVNTLPIGASRRESDIDVLLVARAGRLYTMRFIAVVAATLFGLYRSGEHVADQLCLSFSVSERALDVMPLAKSGGDPYLQFWVANVHVVAERDGVFDAFWRTNAPLLVQLPNARLRRLPKLVRAPRLLSALRDASERLLVGSFGDRVEAWAKRFQMRRFAANTQSRARRGGTDVVIADDILKFHERDRREEIRTRWAERRGTLGV